jgi:hypothetical protein
MNQIGIKIFKDKQIMLLTEAVLIGKEFLKKNKLILNEWLSFKIRKLK